MLTGQATIQSTGRPREIGEYAWPPEGSNETKRTHLTLENFMGDFETNSSENHSIVSVDESLEELKINQMYGDNQSDQVFIVFDELRAANVPSEQDDHQNDSLSVSAGCL